MRRTESSEGEVAPNSTGDPIRLPIDRSRWAEILRHHPGACGDQSGRVLLAPIEAVGFSLDPALIHSALRRREGEAMAAVRAAAQEAGFDLSSTVVLLYLQKRDRQ